MDKLTLAEAFFCDLIWLSALIICLNHLKKSSYNNTNYFFLWLFMTLYATFEFTGGDYFHYKRIYHEIILTNTQIHLEDFYYTLITILPNDYNLWRFTIWGLASLFWILTLKNLKQNPYFSGLIFLSIVFFNFVGARQSLNFAVLYYAISVLYKNDKFKLSNIIIAILLLIWTYTLHKTAIVYILILIIAILPFTKKYIIISLLLFPIIYASFDFFTTTFISSYSSYNSDNAETMERYMGYENSEINILGMIRLIIDRISIFLLLSYSILNIYFRHENISKTYKTLLNISYILIYISYLFVGRDISNFIAPRFWDAALFPFTIFLGGYLYNKRNSVFFKICLTILILSKLYTLFYTIYKL